MAHAAGQQQMKQQQVKQQPKQASQQGKSVPKKPAEGHKAPVKPPGGYDAQRQALKPPIHLKNAAKPEQAAATADAGAAPATVCPFMAPQLGGPFATLAEVEAAMAAQPGVIGDIFIDLPSNAVVHVEQQTTWYHYNPEQRLVLRGNGAEISGKVADPTAPEGWRPTPGYCISYRPLVGPDTAGRDQNGKRVAKPAAANISVSGLTISGFENGGIEISPQTSSTVAGQPLDPNLPPGLAAHEAVCKDGKYYDGGIDAFVSGAQIDNCHFKDLGTLYSKEGEANTSTRRFGAGGVLMRGVMNATVSNNHFTGLEAGQVNGKDGSHLMHAVYLNNMSQNAKILNNTFDTISGDPIRVSDASNDAQVQGNTSRNAGKKSFLSAWHHYDPDKAVPQEWTTWKGKDGKSRRKPAADIGAMNTIGTGYKQKRKPAPFQQKRHTGERADFGNPT
jgi:hypothetical protein